MARPPASRSRGRALVGRIVLDTAPLRQSPAYRRLWIGNGLSGIGSQMTNYAVLLQVFVLTHSSLSVGLVGLTIAVPAVVAAVAGSAIGDVLDRRQAVLVATGILAGLSGVLTAQAFAHLDRVWPLYVLLGLQSGVNAVNGPIRRTFMPMLLRREQFPAGAALQMLTLHGSVTIGPALAGVITAALGLKVCYLVDTISFGFALYGVARLPRCARPGAGSGPDHGP